MHQINSSAAKLYLQSYYHIQALHLGSLQDNPVLLETSTRLARPRAIFDNEIAAQQRMSTQCNFGSEKGFKAAGNFGEAEALAKQSRRKKTEQTEEPDRRAR